MISGKHRVGFQNNYHQGLGAVYDGDTMFVHADLEERQGEEVAADGFAACDFWRLPTASDGRRCFTWGLRSEGRLAMHSWLSLLWLGC